jgi:hypothetical protein
MEALLLLIVLAAVLTAVAVPAVRRRHARPPVGPGFARVGAGFEERYGFTPVGGLELRLPGPDPQLIDALEEARDEQDWHGPARLLALTGDDWEQRWQRVQSVAGGAARELQLARAHARDRAGAADGGRDAQGPSLEKTGPRVPDARWLREWRAEQPGDPGAAQVYAQFLVWQALAEPDSTDHRIILEEARTICHEAARLQPADPTPYVTELVIARHLRYRRPDFEAVWAEVTRRAPHHMGAHLEALRYWSHDGCGSKAEADVFARAAAAGAPAGTLLPALPLFASYAHLPEVSLVRGLYRSAEISTALEAAEFAVDGADDEDPARPHVLHLLVWFLVRAERYGEAMDALQAVDGCVGAVPWTDSPDPVALYATYRAHAVAGWEATGGTAA